MERGTANLALRRIRTLYELGTLGGMTDAQLLELFLARAGDDAEDAFAALVHRHGPMVLGVCRRMLSGSHVAEDAFQATFLILVRRAGSIGRRERLASWLYGVAVRTAKEARRRAARRQAREERAMDLVKVESEPVGDRDDLIPILDEELSRLPDRYRAALVACELEGKSRRAAAQQLGLPEGTLSTHLARGRKLLRDRLVKRGVSLGVGALAGLPRGAVEAAVPDRLLSSTVRAALGYAPGGGVAATVAALAEGVLKMMLVSRLTLFVASVMTVGMAVFAACVVWAAVPAGPGEPPKAQVAAKADDRVRAGDRAVTGPAARHARVHGEVVDEAGKPVPGIEVRVVKYDGHRSRGVTNSAGQFDLLNWGRRVYQGDENAPFRDSFGSKVMTDEEGRFVLPKLVVGQEYRISVPRENDSFIEVDTILPSDAVHLDLGTLQVEVNGRNREAISSFRKGGPGTGDLAPGFGADAHSHGARTLDGRPLKLEDFRGKFVLLDFWATWCGPYLAEIPQLQAVHETFGRDPRFVMLGLSVDEAIDAPRQFQEKRKLPWMQGFLGEGIQGAIPARYGVRAVPALVLVGPDGKIVAKGMRGQEIQKVVSRALKGN